MFVLKIRKNYVLLLERPIHLLMVAKIVMVVLVYFAEKSLIQDSWAHHQNFFARFFFDIVTFSCD